MNIREWALVAFTLLMQASVGILVTVAVVQASAGRWPSTRDAFGLPLLVSVVAALAALGASLLHLGQPFHAFLAVVNVRTSWLSREIVLGVVFVAALLVSARTSVLRGTMTTSPAAWLAVVAGVATLYAMARLYMVPAQPVWNRVVTPVAFFSTALLFGAVVVLALGDRSVYPLADPAVSRLLVVAALLLALAQIAVLPIQLAALPTEASGVVTLISHASGRGLAVLSAACALGVIGILAGLLRPGVAMPHAAISRAAASTLVVLVVASAVLARLLFYASSVGFRPR